jgi:hypothetical protein
VSRRFFIASRIVALIAGAGGGLLLTLTIARAGSITGIADASWFITVINANVHALIMGWVGLIAIGVTYEVLPQCWQRPISLPGMAGPIFWLLALGLIARVGGELMALRWPDGLSLALAGSTAEIAATVLFAMQLGATVSGVRDYRKSMLVIGAIFFCLSALFDAWYTQRIAVVRADFTELVRVVSTWQQILRILQVHGMALFLLLPLALYEFPGESQRNRFVTVVLTLFAVIAEIAFFLVYRLQGNHVFAALLLVPWIVLLAATTLLASPWRWWRRGAPGLLRAACAWLAFSLVMHLFLREYNVLLGAKFSHAYFAAMGQATALGFVMQMLMALTTPSPPRQFVALLNLGIALQVVALIGTDWHQAWAYVLGVAGIIQSGVLIWWILPQPRRGDTIQEPRATPWEQAKKSN